jgi:hypothetical protein
MVEEEKGDYSPVRDILWEEAEQALSSSSAIFGVQT